MEIKLNSLKPLPVGPSYMIRRLRDFQFMFRCQVFGGIFQFRVFGYGDVRGATSGGALLG